MVDLDWCADYLNWLRHSWTLTETKPENKLDRARQLLAELRDGKTSVNVCTAVLARCTCIRENRHTLHQCDCGGQWVGSDSGGRARAVWGYVEMIE